MSESEEVKKIDKKAAFRENVQDAVYKPTSLPQGYMSATRKHAFEPEGSPLWLITFTDIMALMLTFFVLMYSMSQPKEEEWKKMSKGLTISMTETKGLQYFSGEEDSISIDKIDTGKALSLNYLAALVSEIISKNTSLKNVVVLPQADHLVLSLPVDLLFQQGQAEVNADGKRALFALGGPLSKLRNRIEIEGHTDPKPVEGGAGEFTSNWELSINRAANVAAVLQNVGYTRPITIKGLSSARYDELPGSMSEEQRLNLSRRVDIVIMRDDGKQKSFMEGMASPVP